MSMETLKKRIEYMGGDNLGRIKQQKLLSLRAALHNDYNSRKILLPDNVTNCYCLINDDNTKSDYDKRYVSVEFSSGLQPGDVFECVDDNTHWMIYLQDLVEIAYLKAEIIRCRYQLEIGDNKYWIYFQGPTETDVRWNLKEDISWNDLNLSGTIYIQSTDETKNYFDRFTKLKIDGHTWEVQVVDTITVPGIIELEIQEYFDSITEDLVEVKKVDDSSVIIGKTAVIPGEITGYQINESLYDFSLSWNILNNDDVTIQEITNNGLTCAVKVSDDAADGTFEVQYGTNSIDVSIVAPTSVIQGESKVYPYGTYIYTATEVGGVYSVSNTNARIRYQADGKCQIEIVTGKKGSFELTYTINDQSYTLPIKILSL